MNSASRSRKPLWRRIARTVHLWLGLAVIIPLTVISITGIILAGIFLNKEIRNNISPATRYISTSAEIGWIVNIADSYEKDGFLMSSIRMPEKADGEITVHFTNPENSGIMRVILEPVSLRIIKTEYGNGVERAIIKLHSSFLINGGKTVVGFIGIVLCVMSVSGVIVWIPRSGHVKNSSIPRFSLRGKALYINLHKSFGIWSAVFVTVIGFTGTALVFPKQFRYLISPFSSVRDLKSMPKSGFSGNTDIQNVVANAMESVPNNGVISIQFPQKPDDPYRFILRPIEERYGISVFVDGGGKVFEVREPNRYSSGEKFMMWLGFLHKGNGMGILWRLLQVFFGTALLLFIITGFLIWVKGRRV